MSNEVVEYEPGHAVSVNPAPVSLFRTDDPQEIVARASSVATALARVIDERGLYSNIQGRRHVRVEGWTLCGSMLGVFPVCEWSRPIEGGWEARVVARTMGGVVVGAAEASCTRSERTWSGRDDYALRSMAQTRATSKAMRLPLGFIVSLAGYESTPAEEMDGIEREERPVRRAPEKAAAKPGKRSEPTGDWRSERVAFGKKPTKLGGLGEVVPADLKWSELIDGATRDGRRYGWLADGLAWCKEQEDPGAVVRLFMERAPLAMVEIEKADASA